MPALPQNDGSLVVGVPYPVQKDPVPGDPTDYYDEVERAFIIKWSVFGGIFLLLALWITLGHLHARARLRKGLPLLAYHKYLVPASMVRPSQADNAFNLNRIEDTGYYAPPPPAYDPTQPPPPIYEPCSNDSKPAHLQEQSSVQPHGEQTHQVDKHRFLPKSWKFSRRTT